MIKLRADKGQAIVPEYIVIFFIVMTAIAAITIFVQRALQARVRDARTYMMDTASAGCAQSDQSGTTDCLGAAGANNGKMAYEYEPYYTVSNSLVDRDQVQSQRLDASLTATGLHSLTQVDSKSVQLPPAAAK